MPFSRLTMFKKFAATLGATRSVSHLARTASFAVLTAIVSTGSPLSAQETPTGTLDSCLKAVSQTSDKEISCSYMALLTPKEREDMQHITRGLLQDASCLVKIRIARTLVEPALSQPDHVFQAPPQPVTCDIRTKDGGFPITATFAPQVTFKAGKAVAGSPGLANVEGINSYVAWPVVIYVNKSARIRNGMLDIINLYKPHLKPKD